MRRTTVRTEAGFVDDLQAAIWACRRRPLLPVAALVMGGVFDLGAILEPLAPIALVVWIPWAGIERLWYARAFTGGTVTIADVPRLFLRLFGRFLRLLLLVGVSVGGVIVALAWFSRDGDGDGFFWFGLAIVGAALTFTLTFVLPVLTFSTTRVRSALRTGVSMIHSNWPASAPYVLVPALVPVPLTMAASLELPGPWSVALNLLGTLLELLFVGATTRFFVRREMGLPVDGPRVANDHA